VGHDEPLTIGRGAVINSGSNAVIIIHKRLGSNVTSWSIIHRKYMKEECWWLLEKEIGTGKGKNGGEVAQGR